jgi:moderate conductance mechanosensitive channel
MDLVQLFSSENLKALALPVGVGAAIVIVALILRHYIYKLVRKMTEKTKTCFDDILVKDTGLATILWGVWLGLWAGFTIAETPSAWDKQVNQIVPVVFVALGIYTLIVIIMAVFKWYKVEICPQTSSSLDDMIMATLLFGTPIVGGALGIILILNMFGIKNENINNWLGEHLGSLAVLTIGTVILLLGTVMVVPRIIRTTVRNSKAEQSEDELKKRGDTLSSVIVTTLQVVIIFIFILMFIPQILPKVNIAPILTGAGVLGLAVGFGAQSLVKDVLAGLFVIMENQYRKGDVVRIADTSGVVEEINLRRTILRDNDGITHTVPNGEIRVASNYTKILSRVNLNIGVSYDTDLDHAIRVINQVGQQLFDDPVWHPSLITPPKAIRVDKLGDSSIEIKIMGETKPSRQWDVAGELRLRLKKAFDKEHIEIPWPHTKVFFGNLPQQFPASYTGPDKETKPPEKKNLT